MNKIDKCVLIPEEHDLDRALKANNKIFILFYASWCQFSAKFLPIFMDFALSHTQKFVRIMIDDKKSLAEKYFVEVVPTVLFFENGKLAKRLDGELGLGLSKKYLRDFINNCSL